MTGIDICVRNARLRRRGDALVDVAIAGGRIVALGPALDVTAREEIDADGNLVTESYVNPHLHLCKVWTLPMMAEEALKSYRAPGMAHTASAIDLASKVKASYDASWIIPNARRAVALAALYGSTHIRAFADVDAKARLEGIKAAREERIARAAKLATDKGRPGAINPHYLMAELGKVLDDEDIIFNEGVTNAGAVLLQIPRRVPNTTMRSGGGGLGWSGGMALGAKLAAPDRLMVQISGDGGFYFGNPSSVFAVAQQYKLPIFSIVMDNSGWNAVKQSTLRVFPEGEAKSANEFEAELAPKVHFTKVGEAFGAYAEEVGDPADVTAAIARCVKEVRGGRAALLHARVTRM